MKNIKEGYKKTLAGEIPEKWGHEELNKLVDKITDGTHKTPTYTEDGIPFLRVTDIQESNINWNNVKYISEKEHLELIKRCKPEIGDILYSKNGTIGIPKIIDWKNEFSIFVSLCLIKMKKENSLIINRYLEQFLKSDSCMRQIRLRAKQGTVTNLHLEEIRELMIPIPSIKEQVKISSILSTVDEQIDNVDVLIEKNKDLKKGLMQQLLTKGIGHTKFKKTEIGEIPEEWEIKELGSICEIKSSKRVYQSDYVDSGVPFYRSKEIIELSKGNLPTVELFIERNKFDEFKDKYGVPQFGDLMITSVGSVGETWVCDGREFYYKDGNLTQIVNNKQINTRYISYVFKCDYLIKQYLGQSSGSVQVALTLEKLKKLVVAFPSINEQERIVNILLTEDKKIKEYENKKQKLEELKKGLMQQLLTGNIRVN